MRGRENPRLNPATTGLYAAQMVELDVSLLDSARRLTNAANVHSVNTWIYCYEESVNQEHSGRPYNSKFENLLRNFVRTKTLSKLTRARAQEATPHSSETSKAQGIKIEKILNRARYARSVGPGD